MMTSTTGNKFLGVLTSYRNHRGFTFIEVMMTLAVLSGGIIMLFKAFFLCLDYQNHLSYRVHASNLLEHKIAITEQMARDYKTLSFEHDRQDEEAVFNNKPINFHTDIQVVPVADIFSLYQLTVSISWEEQKRHVTLTRKAYISNLTSLKNL